ncbi:MAG: hypothetical protein UV43_C0040G0021, partial [Parcubacteria group bacterium GW2011_GWF2_42_7]
QRSLAAAGGPEQREEFALRDVERERLDRREGTSRLDVSQQARVF